MAGGRRLRPPFAESMLCFSTGSNRDIPKIRILAESIKRFHPGWTVSLVLSEPLAGSCDLAREPFSVVRHDELGIERLDAWLFMHNEMAARLALKGPAAEYLLRTLKADKVMYLDAASVVFDSLAGIDELLDQYSICLVPQHSNAAAGTQRILRDEVAALRQGSFDLGFFAIRNDEQGNGFAKWWKHRLLHYCYQNDERGIYFDQKWCNLAPALFENLHILRDPSYSVNIRNIHGHALSRRMNAWALDDLPIRVFRFIQAEESDAGRSGRGRVAGEALRDWYETELVKHDHGNLSSGNWSFASFGNGAAITDEMRWTYRTRPDLQSKYRNPFSTGPSATELLDFFEWKAGRERRL